MPLPMVHLLVADDWARDKPQRRDCPEFYLGAIAPDAIYLRAGIQVPDDKERSPLNSWRKLNLESVYRYWQERSAPFDLGYGMFSRSWRA